MGGSASKTICLTYENVNNETKAKILEEFKNTYSDRNIKELHVSRGQVRPFYIYINNYNITFMYEPNLIDFICELNRPFVFADIEERGYCIRFVYGKST
jgi:hypothetical protein